MALFVREQNVMQLGMRFKQYRVFLVLDSSGSMEGKPWSTVVAGVAKILDHLDEDDKISASTFSDTVQQLMTFEPVTKTNAMQLIQKLANTKCNGRTALYDALAAAIKSTLAATLMVKMLLGDKEKYVLLVLTDGENNSGNITFDEAKKMMTNIGQKGDLISTVFIGVNLNDRARSSLKALADAGGNETDFYDINDLQIEEIFDRIAITLQAAKRVTVAGVAGMAGIRPGSAGGLAAIGPSYDGEKMWMVLRDLHQGIRNSMLGNINLSKPSNLSGYYDGLLEYEKALRSEAHTAEWMSGTRDEWLAEVKNASKYSQGHFASCLVALEADLKQEAQEPLWLMLQRSNWKRACDSLGARNLNLGAGASNNPLQRLGSYRHSMRQDPDCCIS